LLCRSLDRQGLKKLEEMHGNGRIRGEADIRWMLEETMNVSTLETGCGGYSDAA